MRNRSIFFALTLAANLAIAPSALAHPGNTNDYSSHYCYTNCSQYGLTDGEYHYHKPQGGYISSSSQLTVFIPEEIPANAGAEVKVPVMASQINGISSFAVSVIYNPSVISFVRAENTTFAPTMSYVTGTIDHGGGFNELVIGGTSSTPLTGNGLGSLVDLVFTSPANSTGIATLSPINPTDDISAATLGIGSINFDLTPSGITFPDYSNLTAWIPNSIAATAGSEVTVPIYTSELYYIIGFSFSMTYDSTLLTFTRSESTTDAPGYTYTNSTTDAGNNLTELIISGSGPSIQTPGPGKIVNLVFTASNTNGTAIIDLTDVDEGGLPVTVIDGSVDITGGSVISDPVNLTDTVGSVEIDKPNNGKDDLTNDKNVTIKGYSSGTVVSVEVDGDQADFDAATGDWEIDIKLDEGKNDIDVIGLDASQAEVASDSMEIELDTEAPDDVENLEISGASLTWSEPDSKDAEEYIVYRMVNGKEKKIDKTSKQYATIDGNGPFRVTAVDEAGNESDIDDAPEVNNYIVGVDTGFIDVPATHWASGYINMLKNKGIVHGVDNYYFPERPVTRAEYSKMLIGAVSEHTVADNTPYLDVRPEHPMARFVNRVFRLGWARGEGRYFNPERPITRIEASWMTLRAARLSESQPINFIDIDHPVQKIIASMMVENGILTGNGNRFMPNDYLTRAEAAKVISKVIEKAN